jgi:single-strand DNA-binding protein
MMNRVELIGRLTADPELKYTPAGTALANVRIAVDRRRREGETERQADFFGVVLWGKVAENVCQYQGKGNRVAVAGRLQTRSWEKDGQRPSLVEVVAEQVDFLERCRDGTSAGSVASDTGNDEDEGEVPF